MRPFGLTQEFGILATGGHVEQVAAGRLKSRHPFLLEPIKLGCFLDHNKDWSVASLQKRPDPDINPTAATVIGGRAMHPFAPAGVPGLPDIADGTGGRVFQDVYAADLHCSVSS
jgi:hypothetical protein